MSKQIKEQVEKLEGILTGVYFDGLHRKESIVSLSNASKAIQSLIEQAKQEGREEVMEDIKDLDAEFKSDEVFGFVIRGKLNGWQAQIK